MPKKANQKQQQHLEHQSDPHKKTKIAKKNQKKPKPQKKNTNKLDDKGNEQKSNPEKKAPVGRPKRPQSFNVIDDPTTNIQQIILEYLDSIGLKHGLVFRNEERKVFKQQNLGIIKWNDDHEWNPQKQREKIKKDPEIEDIIKKFVDIFHSNKQNKPHLIQLFQECLINIGDIAAEECTSEIYHLIVEQMQSNINNQNKDARIMRAKNLLKKCYFMSGTFTKKSIKYWVQLQKVNEIEKKFIEFFDDLWQKVKELFTKKMKHVEQFVNQQKEMNQLLLKIRNNALKEIEKKNSMQDEQQ